MAAPYDASGKLRLFRDSGIESRKETGRYYGTQGEDLTLDSISALPEFRDYSQEELRSQDYAVGLLKSTSVFGDHSASAQGAVVKSDTEGSSINIEVASALVLAILQRLSAFFSHVRPGLISSQREVDSWISFLQSLESAKEALTRMRLRIVAGTFNQLKGPVDAQEDLEQFAELGLRVKFKQSKQRKKTAAVDKAVEQERLVHSRDQDLLYRAGLSRIDTEGRCDEALAELDLKPVEALKVSPPPFCKKPFR